MPIDRIGKPGTPPAVEPTSSTSSDAPRRFGVDGASGDSPASPAAKASASPAVGPLEQLRSGAISLDGYLDLKVGEATSHLVALPPAHLEAVRAALRDRLSTDPTLVDLVRTATGSVPSPSPGARDD
jgi:hypothetical protein